MTKYRLKYYYSKDTEKFWWAVHERKGFFGVWRLLDVFRTEEEAREFVNKLKTQREFYF